MNWLHLVSYFFGGLFLANVVPHFVSGIMGKPFQTPFAKPPGKGLSSSTVNVLWGFANFVFAICFCGALDTSIRDPFFRLWTAGGLVSNIGTWMQRVAQDWIVLTQLTHHDATAVGIVTGLQFAPQLLLLP
jgi:hypothetical protein